MTATTNNPSLRDSRTAPAATLHSFPPDLATWVERGHLLATIRTAAARAWGNSWRNLVDETTPAQPVDDLLVLVAYCYVQGIYHSIDVVRRLDEDEVLEGLRERLALAPERVRRFRRERRRALTDCLTLTFAALWRERHAGIGAGGAMGSAGADEGRQVRPDFSFLEPFYLQAQDRIDRAVVLDSMALDF